ncbi:hypothetical protein Tco_1280566 [Tanacetum coccineum]
MPYPRFTKIIINHFISKDKTISMRNRINLHTIRDDSLLEAEPVKKAKRVKRAAKKSTTTPITGVIISDTPGVSVSKKKAPAKADKGKGIELLSDAALLKAAQVKEDLKKSKKDSHMLHASGLGDGVAFQPKVPDESEDKTTGTDEGTGTKPGVPDVPTYESDSDNESWGDSEDESDDINDDDNAKDEDSKNEDDDGNDAQIDTTDLLNTGILSGANDNEDVGAEADLNNLETTMNVSPIPTTRIHKDHPKN